jgi:transposase
MTQHAAFDVSLKVAHGCIVDANGQVLKEGKVAAEPEAMAAWLNRHAPELARVGIETGPLATWHLHALRKLGVPVVCLDARHAHKVLSCWPIKTDKNDARGLAELVRLGAFRQVAVRSEASVRRRALLGAREQLVKMRRDVENQIRGLLRSFGRLLGSARGRAFAGRAKELVADEPLLAAIIEPLLRVRERLVDEVAALEGKLVAEARTDPVCRRLATVPGVGPITALAFQSGVDDVTRFEDRRQVGAWLGLVPRRHQSGKMDYSGKISKAGDGRVRALLFEAAHVLLSRVKRGCALKDWAEQLARRVGMRKAKVAVARKLAVLLARLWAKEEVFRWQAA